MGKCPVVSKLPKSDVINDGKERPFNALIGSILTADEYCSAITALVVEVEDVLEDNDKMADLSSALRRLLLSRYDAPLPLWWTFIAVEKSLWLDRKSGDPLEVGTGILNFASRVSQSLNPLSAVNASGRTALSATAPIVGLLYDVAFVLNTTVGSLDNIQSDIGTIDCNGKRVRKLSKKLKESVKELLSFTVLCHCKDSKTFERSFSLPPAPNVPLERFPDFLHPPFPLASKIVAKSLRRGSSNAAFLADVVYGEAVLLQLVVETIHRRILLKKKNANFSVGHDEFVQKLKNLAIHSVWAGSSPSELLLDLLLEKRLPVLDLLDAKEETLVRGVLFETVLVDAPLFSRFCKADGESKSSNSGLDHTNVVFMKKLSVARQAVAFFRSQEERGRLATLLTEMTTWHVPQQLFKWLKSQKKQRLPVIALQDQQALINWLVNTAEKSAFTAILDKSVATLSSGLTSVGTANLVEVLEVENGDAHSDGVGEDLFFVDTAGETQLLIDSETAADLDFIAAAKSMTGESDKMKKKKKKKHSKVLFHRHEQSSTGTKRSRIDIGDGHLTSSSGSDSEDSEENGSKSAKKKVKKSKRKAVDIIGTSEEDDDDDNAGALASVHHASNEENSPPVKSGDVSNQQAELLPQRTESPKDQAFVKGMKGGAVEQDAVKVQRQLVVDSKEIASQGTLSVGTSSTSSKGEEEQRFDLIGGIETEELPSGPYKETVITSVSANEVDIQNALTISQAEAVLSSPGKSAKKKKKKPNDPEVPDVGEPADTVGKRKDGPLSTSVSNKKLVSRDSEANTEGKGDAQAEEILVRDIQNSATVSQSEQVVLSVGKSFKKKKTRSKGSENPDILELVDSVGKRKDGPLSTGTPNKKLVIRDPEANIEGTGNAYVEEDIIVSTAIQALETRADVQGEAAKDLAQKFTTTNSEESPMSPTVSQVGPVLLSVEKSAKKKKSKDLEDPHIGEPVNTVSRSKDGPLSVGEPNTKLVNEDLEANTEGKGEAYPEENIVVNTAIQAVETGANVQGEAAKDLAQKVTIANCEEFSLSPLTTQHEGSDGLGEVGHTAVVHSASPRNVQEDVHIVKSNKKKRMKENQREGGEGDDLQIFDTIKQELVTASAIVSSADLIEALQVGKSLPADQQARSRKMTTRSKRARLGDEGNNIGDLQGTVTRESAVTVSVVNSDKMSIANETTQDGKVSQGGMTLAEEEAILSETLMEEILGSRQAEDANGRMHGESEQNISTPVVTEAILPVDTVVLGLPTPVATQANLAVGGAVLGAEDGAQDTARPVGKSTKSPIKNMVEQTRLQSQGTPTSGTIGTSPSKKNRDVTGTSTSRKKRSKGQTVVGPPAVAEEIIQPKEEVCEEAPSAIPVEMLNGGTGQDEREVRTPVAKGRISDTELLTSMKPSSRKRKVDTPQSVGSETTDEILYERRTRSGRALGTPTPAPIRKENMRRKLVLEPLEEDK